MARYAMAREFRNRKRRTRLWSRAAAEGRERTG